jgi:hypothetical protein
VKIILRSCAWAGADNLDKHKTGFLDESDVAKHVGREGLQWKLYSRRLGKNGSDSANSKV